MTAGVIITGVIVVGVIVLYISSAGKRRPKLVKENIPANLGVLSHVPIQPLINQLNTALDDEYIQQVKQRYLKDFPNRSEDEFEWLLFELKRYFIVANILKKAPMFSEDVDEIWHEMILFTKNYQAFSEKFLGKMLHHTPNTNPEPAPQERAFFDWIFSQLFEITQFSWKTWGNFFKYPMESAILKEFKESSTEALIEKYFQRSEENKDVLEFLVNRLKKQLSEAENMYRANPKGSFSKQRTYGDMAPLALGMVFFSYFYFDHYWEYMRTIAFAEAAKYTSGCTTAVFCGSTSSDDSGKDSGNCGGDSGGGDGGGSSCSSCSSCGSGCSS
ncbi:hypothetical protein ACFPA1_28730 [Neobacillus sp. GCM10023253]|uniref:hypothetical protein n=1 Tax=Neobacillus sp. GCM10023253 TaxID=3252644 RepID=UPI00361729C0